MNPLRSKEIDKLRKLGLDDLERKIQEIIDRLTEIEDPISHKKTGHQFKSKDLPNIIISIG